VIAQTTRHFLQRAASGFLLIVFAAPTLAQSMGQVDAELKENERYAQVVDQPAVTFSLLDPQGRTVRLADFHGQVVVLNFLYARCHDTWPLHSALIARIQTLVKEVQGLSEQVRFITVATDTEDASETATLMRQHGEKYGLDPQNWSFLHGGPGRTRSGIDLAKDYGLEFMPSGTGQQMHATVTYVIDANGRLRARFHGLAFEPVRLMLYAAALAHGQHTVVSTRMDFRDIYAQLMLGALFAVFGLVIFFMWRGWNRHLSHAANKEVES
jgi:protein SCO1/2